jgi:hypothetical protein
MRTTTKTPANPCAEEPDLWFSDDAEETELAKDFCLDCPLFFQCRELGWDHEFGVFGGLSGEDRDEIRPERVLAREALARAEEEARMIARAPLPDELNQKIIDLAASGVSSRDIAAEVGLGKTKVLKVVRAAREAGADIPVLANANGARRLAA